MTRRGQKRGRPQICNLDEVKSLNEEAIKQDCVTWFVWGFFTGMRPAAEMKPFWQNPEFGWRFVDLEERKIIVSEEIEKTGKRTNEIKIQENLLHWIELFRSQPTRFPMYPTNRVRKFRRACRPGCGLPSTESTGGIVGSDGQRRQRSKKFQSVARKPDSLAKGNDGNCQRL